MTTPVAPSYFPLQSAYTGGSVTVVGPELRGIIEQATNAGARSQQKRIGPSEIGNPCDACLVSKLAGIPEQRNVAWLPWIGTAIHEQLSITFLDHHHRYLVEQKVTVGEIGGEPITGTADIFDFLIGMVVDWKTVGATTLREAKSKGPSAVYRAQAHLYGRGWRNAGFQVQQVGIYYLPRNEPTLANAHLWHEAFNEQIAVDALTRADMFARAINTFGVDNVLNQVGPHLGGHSCVRYGAPDPKVPTTTESLLAIA